MKGLPFVVRAYGIYLDDTKGVLVSDELIKGKYITKFPGGGLEFGEGLVDCVKREMLEETGQEFDVHSHFYTTDFFVASAFDPFYQVISVYYRIFPKEDVRFRLSQSLFDFEKQEEGAQAFRFIPLKELEPKHLTLAIDQKVAELIVDLFAK